MIDHEHLVRRAVVEDAHRLRLIAGTAPSWAQTNTAGRCTMILWAFGHPGWFRTPDTLARTRAHRS